METLFTHWVDPNLAARFKRANERLDGLLVDRERHAITYNHYYTDVLQSLREERQVKALAEKIQQFMGSSSKPASIYKEPLNVDGLARSLATQHESDMDVFACSELLDSVRAFYKVSAFLLFTLDPPLLVTSNIVANPGFKVALKTFVDNVSIHVVEGLLISDIWSIFSPTDGMYFWTSFPLFWT